MDMILSHLSDDELRVKSLQAVEEQLQHAETQLTPVLDVLNCTLSVVRASRDMCRTSIVLVDASPVISTALQQLVAACNEIGSLVCELNREMSSSGESDASPSATEGQKKTNKSSKSEPKTDKPSFGQSEMVTAENVIDLLLSDEEKVDVKKETVNGVCTIESTDVQMEEAPEFGGDDGDVDTEYSVSTCSGHDVDVRRRESTPSREPAVISLEDEKNELEISEHRPRQKQLKKRKVLTPATGFVQGVVALLRRRTEMAPHTEVGEAVRKSLDAAIALEEQTSMAGSSPPVGTFVKAAVHAGSLLVTALACSPVAAERHLEDVRLILSVAVSKIERQLSRQDVREVWKLLQHLQQLHESFPDQTRSIHRNWIRLRKYVKKEYEVPADVVSDLKTRLLCMLVELRGWDPLDSFPVECFDARMSIITELLDGRYEMWEPCTEPLLGRLVATIERICTFMEGDEWNDRYTSICLACSRMSRSTFVSLADLSSELPGRIAHSAILEPGFENEHRVEEDIQYVMSYNDEVRDLRDPTQKTAALEELIDRLRWVFNAVVLTRKQSLLPITRLKRLNQCLSTLVGLSDHGEALTLEGCLHLEKLLVAIRQLMFIRIDYAKCSKVKTEALLGLFPAASRPLFVYP